MGAVAGAVAVAVAVFSVILPYLNALLDWISWGVTRFFLAKAEWAKSSVAGALILAAELLADFLIAALLLVLLATLIPIAVEITNLFISAISSDFEPIAWSANLETAIRNPWREGFFVTGMLITTLIPTFLHLVAGLAGVFFAWMPDARTLAARIPYDPGLEAQKPMDVAFKDEIVRRVRHVRYWYAPAGVVVALAMYGFFWLFGYVIEPFGLFLADAAFCGTAWTGHGRCPWW